MNALSFIFLLLTLTLVSCVPDEASSARVTGEGHLRKLVDRPWMSGWRDARLVELRLVRSKSGLPWGQSPDAWWAKIVGPKGGIGHLAWEAKPPGRVLEFFVDELQAFATEEGGALAGVPALQQFPIRTENGPAASGCVPTAGASLMDYWIARGAGKWAGVPTETARDRILRIRERLKYRTIPDIYGFTDGSMALTGAFTEDLARNLYRDARERGVELSVGMTDFMFETLRREITLGRPALASCVVPLPQKPELTWGHEVVCVGWAEVGGARFVGVIDNFFPVRNPGAVRWIAEDKFRELVVVGIVKN
ncbi:MAG: hypothetical protein ACK467_11155 [Opitutia bacterium]